MVWPADILETIKYMVRTNIHRVHGSKIKKYAWQGVHHELADIFNKVMVPVVTDRHGFFLYEGDTVQRIEDDSHFVISGVTTINSSPAVHLLFDERWNTIDASIVMLTDDEKHTNSRKRASFCSVCFNHFEQGVVHLTCKKCRYLVLG